MTNSLWTIEIHVWNEQSLKYIRTRKIGKYCPVVTSEEIGVLKLDCLSVFPAIQTVAVFLTPVIESAEVIR